MKIKGFKDTIEWYDKNSEKYANSAEKVRPIKFIEQFLSMLPKAPKVLDAGCGSGRDSRILNEKGAKVIGLDISKGLLKEAEKRSKDIEYVLGDITVMKFLDSSFDGVWSHASLVHFERIEDVEKTLDEYYRILKPGGILHIFTKEQLGDYKTAIVSDSLSNHDRFFRYYSKEELRNLVSQAGFGDLDISSVSDPHGREEVSWIILFGKKILKSKL
jgi:ubiquinone/menaquinone biosynthesis C-methylase UbiE